MKKRIYACILAVCMLALLLGGCAAPAAAPNDYYSYESAPQAEPAMPAPMPATAPADADYGGWGYDVAEEVELAAVDTAARQENAVAGGGGAKIIRNAGISLETKEFRMVVEHITQQAVTMGGYVSNSYVSGKEPESYYDNGRYASITVRIPVERLDSFLADTRGLATVISESMTGDDITASYRDTESRLEVYTTQRERVLALLEKAETMEDIIALETELSRLTYEIENLTGSLRQWDDLVDYATVNVDVNEIPPSTPVTGDESFGTRVGDGLRRTLNGMAVFFENTLVFLIAASPVLLILAAIAVVVILLLKRHGKKQRARMEANAYEPPKSTYGKPANAPEKEPEEKEEEV